MDEVDAAALIEALEAFCATIEATGGLVPDADNPGFLSPMACEDWVDLGLAYEKASASLAGVGRPRNA